MSSIATNSNWTAFASPRAGNARRAPATPRPVAAAHVQPPLTVVPPETEQSPQTLSFYLHPDDRPWRDRIGRQFWTGSAVVAIHAGLLALAFTYHQYYVADKPVQAMLMVSVPDFSPPPPPEYTPPEPVADIPPVTLLPPIVEIATPRVQPIIMLPAAVPATSAPRVASASVGTHRPPAPAVAKSDDLMVSLTEGVPPIYPSQSRRLGEEGTVVLDVTVGTDGRVQHIAIHSSSGHDRLDQAALRAVRKWRWQPLIRNGVATAVNGLVEIPFILTRKAAA